MNSSLVTYVLAALTNSLSAHHTICVNKTKDVFFEMFEFSDSQVQSLQLWVKTTVTANKQKAFQHFANKF